MTPITMAGGDRDRQEDEENGNGMLHCANSKNRFLQRLDHESLDEFLVKFKPTQVSKNAYDWISLDNVNSGSSGYSSNEGRSGSSLALTEYFAPLSGLEEALASQGRVPGALREECVRQILDVARRRGHKVGKWMLFASHDAVDSWWATIARATLNGKLGCSAKVAASGHLAPSSAETTALICVYVQDFDDKAEIKRVLLALKGLGFPVTAGFKPDMFTMLNIKSPNPWRLQPTIYQVQEVLDW
jgi:hypothetical protein